MWDVENYGADSEVVKFLQNHEGAQGCEGLRHQTDMGFYRIFAKDQIVRDRKGGIPRTFKQFKKPTGHSKPREGFRKMKANVEKRGERNQSFGEKQSRLAKVEGI